jgi:hypothetical protein
VWSYHWKKEEEAAGTQTRFLANINRLLASLFVDAYDAIADPGRPSSSSVSFPTHDVKVRNLRSSPPTTHTNTELLARRVRACVSLSHSLSLAASLCDYLCLSVYLSVSVSLCVTGKRKKRERKQLEQQSGATIEQD